MQLQFEKPPRAGSKFRLRIVDPVGIAHTIWALDGDVVNTFECDDPPCYEEMYISPYWEGRELHIVSTDSRETRELRFRIEGTDLVPTPATGAQQAR
jgi:hypothetical protein